MAELDGLRADLVAEQQALDDIVAGLGNDQWSLPTPSPGWNVADQIGHLTYFDGTAALAITDPDAFRAGVESLFASAGSDGGDDFTLGAFRALAPAQQLAAWRANRRLLAEAAATLSDTTRIAWYGPSMGAKSFLTARLMEVWAHGTDIIDTVGGHREPTDRLRHIAQLGFITRGWSYTVRGQEAPTGDMRLELNSPSGELWTWGPDDAADTVRGSAEDFCLVVTQRRHVDDTDLQCSEIGRHWLLRAQAFAGGATNVPEPRRS
ncbi:unannotated protein [freshwater metagenome]|uniref:Unannotated protein n=1 Tax=freshwater metagenome TaxID=449393 RepID=A0A6J7ECH1_9ZZZZ|nr:TIGR03084 family protein [Actinomycetota bacterium]